MGSLDLLAEVLSIGFPKAFYIFNCGLGASTVECPAGLNFWGLIIDILFWYIVAVVIKMLRKTNSTKNST